MKELKKDRVIEIGNIVTTQAWESPQRGRIYSTLGLAPTIYTFQGGGLEPKIALYENGRNNMPQQQG